MNYQFFNLLIQVAKAICISIARLFGVRFLTKEATVACLQLYRRVYYPENRLMLPKVSAPTDSAKIIFDRQEAITLPSYVWEIDNHTQMATLLRCGNLMVDGRVLCTDYYNQYLLRDGLKRDKRQRYKTETLVAPFGQYQDGMVFGGYYDFIYLVVAKLCRLEKCLPAGSLTQSVIAYPLFNTSYEQEFLAYLGFRPEQILDSRAYNIQFDRCLLGSSGHWFYPNKADVMAVRDRLFPLVQNPTGKRNRLYISRAGRRRVENEDALVAMLEQYDFTAIDDKPRTLSEQLSIYNQASFIIGPHGASFSNIIWSEPGTQLFELFSPNYKPAFFLYLAKLMGHRYAADFHGSPRTSRKNSLEENIIVSVSAIEQSLNVLLENEYRQQLPH